MAHDIDSTSGDGSSAVGMGPHGATCNLGDSAEVPEYVLPQPYATKKSKEFLVCHVSSWRPVCFADWPM